MYYPDIERLKLARYLYRLRNPWGSYYNRYPGPYYMGPRPTKSQNIDTTQTIVNTGTQTNVTQSSVSTNVMSTTPSPAANVENMPTKVPGVPTRAVITTPESLSKTPPVLIAA